MSGGGNIAYSGTRAEALTVQSSTAGMTIPWLRGMHRVPANLLWYGDFQAISTQEKTGGKGGSPSVEKISYRASLLMGLCHGLATSIPRVWKGKAVTTPAALGLTLRTGALGQAVWSPLVGRGDVAIGYSGIAAIGAYQYGLGESASVENHSLEVQHSSAYSAVAGIPDVDPAVFTEELLSDVANGVGVPDGMLADWSSWSDYCVANDLLMSPLLATQVPASDALKRVADLTNTGIVWSGGQLRMVPYGDAAITANGRTYTPDLTPVYELDANSLLAMGMPPIKMRRRSPADRFNEVPVQYKNRAADYAVDVVRAKDLTDINARGLRTMETIEADWICRGSVARQVGELRKQRSLLVLREFEINLPWHFSLVEGMDILLLTDARFQLDRTPVRIIKIVEDSDETLIVTCEDFPAGVANAPRYPVQGNSGFAHNANAAPGDALAPLVFELPSALTANGLELGIATASTDANWGGCQVWVSNDGTSYRQLTELRGKSRFGITQLDSGASLQIFTNAGQQLVSGSAGDAASLATLIYAAPAGAVAGEYMAYQTADLTAANAYTLSGLVRGAYGTAQVEHGAATPWVRVDDSIARSGPLDPALIGKTIYVKLLSFNLFGAAVQSLAEVDATAYTITGRHYYVSGGQASSTTSIKLNVANFAGAVNYNEAYLHGHDASGAAVDAPGSIMVNGVSVPVPNGSLFTNFGPQAGHIMFNPAGATFSVLGSAWSHYVFTRRYQGAWQYDDNNSGDWTTFTPAAGVVVIGTLVSGAADSGAPGAPPGLIAGNLWAAAESPAAVAATLDAVWTAQVAASSAGANASSALSTLATMRSNGYLDAAEKPMANRQWHALYDDQAGVVAQANALGITTERDAYTDAISALGTYLVSLSPSWTDTTTDTPITPAVDNTKWQNAYVARQVLLNKIADEASKRATWIQVANRPADDAIRNNMVDVGWWKRGAAIPWGQNGEENIMYSTVDVGGYGPRGGSDVVWYAHEVSGGGDSGGGWDAPGTLTLDPTKTYRFVVPIRVLDTGLHGYAYWGVAASSVCDLNGTDTHGNPYFAVGARDAMYTDRWYLFVGFVFPYGSTNNSHAGSGIYDCKTGAVIQSGNNWNHSAGGATGHRAYQYYAGANAVQIFGRPMVNVVDGTEPSLREYFETGAVLNSALVPSITAAQAAADAAQGTANTAASNAGSALTTLATMRSNGYIDASEKPALLKAWQAIADEAAGIYAQGTTYGLVTLRDAYEAARSALASYLSGLSPSWSDTTTDTPITPATDQTTWAAYYSARQALLNAVANETAQRASWAGVSGSGKPADNATVGAPSGTYVAGQLAQDLVTTASNAASTASTAASNASSALSTLATMRSNGYLDASEKPALMRAWQAIVDEISNIGSQGIAYGLTTLKNAYQTAFTDLFTYLYNLSPGWSDTTTDTPITPAVDQATWAAYYSARQTLLIAISDEAAKRAQWTNVSGTDKPADNATVGATFGVDINGQASTSDIAATAVTELASASDHVAYSNIG